MSVTIIIGSGIIGLSTAYYLADHQPGSTIHLVEPSPELFASASGHAGGFLARDWFPPESAALGALSFDEHRRLAEENSGREGWGWSASTAFSHAAAPVKRPAARDADWLGDDGSRAEAAVEAAAVAAAVPADGPPWLRRERGDDVQVMGDPGSTAQVDPLRLCRFLLGQCKSAGVRLHHPATILSVATDLRGDLSSVRIGDAASSTETDVPCARVLVAAGAWSPRVFSGLFPGAPLEVPVASLAGHSLVVRPPGAAAARAGGCHAVFSTDGAGFSPELFSRVGGHVYIAGVNSAAAPLPPLPGQAPVSADAISSLRDTAERLVDGGDGEARLEVVRQGLCFRPVTASGAPILARIPDGLLGGVSTRAGAEGGVFLAAGHGPWGISLSLGTGKVMAELMQGRILSADISGLGLP
ncbi:hypothetical protein EsH8_III_001231 [Colletotrichum jinshuiense]